jgi:hypothetical protein
LPREALRLTKESVFGVYGSGGTVKNTDVLYIDLTKDNSFTMRKKPIQRTLRSASNGNRLLRVWSSQYDLAGSLNLELFPEQTPMIMAFIASLNSGELGSFTADYIIQMDDASSTNVYARYLGNKVASGEISASASDPAVKVALNLIAKSTATITSTDFATPADADYPVGTPYLFTHTASPGFLTLGTSRSEFNSWSVSFNNKLDAPHFEAPAVSRIKFCGRDVTMNTGLLYQSTADRVAYEATTAQSVQLKLNNGTNSLLIDFKNGNFLTDVGDDLKMDNVFYQNLVFVNAYSPSVGTDLAITTT